MPDSEGLPWLERKSDRPVLNSWWKAMSGGTANDRSGFEFPRTWIYRWAPGNGAKTPTEPAPSALSKATGIGPHTGRAEPAVALG